jgi:hypothetical protein
LRAALLEPRAPDDHGFLNEPTRRALERLRSHPEVAFAVLRDAVPRTNSMVYGRALEAMYLVGQSIPEVVKPFLWEVARASDKDRGDFALTSLRNLGLHTEDLPALIQLLPEYKDIVAHRITDVIDADPAGAAPLLDPVRRLLESSKADDRFTAACVLAKFEAASNPQIVAELAGGLTDWNHVRLREALAAIQRAGPAAQSLVPKLIDVAASWSDNSYRGPGFADQSESTRQEVMRTIAALDPEARRQYPVIDQVLTADEERSRWEERLRTGDFTVPDLTAALGNSNQRTAAIRQLGELGPKGAEALPALLNALEGTAWSREKDEIVTAIGKIAPSTEIPRVDNKPILQGLDAAVKALTATPADQRNKPLIAALNERYYGLINHNMWFTREELRHFSRELAASDPSAHQIFINGLLNADPGLKGVVDGK